MKTLRRICAALLALLMVCSVSLTACAEETDRAAPGKEMKAAAPKPTAAPTPTPKAKKKGEITLSGSESYTEEEMRDALGGKPVLLRNSCMDDQLDCDLSLLYEVMDFAVLNKSTTAILPLTKEQYTTALNNLEHGNAYGNKWFPDLSGFEIRPYASGKYRIKFYFRNGDNEKFIEKFLQARAAAIDIVNKIPYTIRSSDNRLRYLYGYVTKNVKYSEKEYWTGDRGKCLLYDALIEHDTVCAGFSYAFAYLCELAGIDAQFVRINRKANYSDGHAVVIATVYDTSRWYDPTWDEGRDEKDYKYFGMTDKDLETNHSGFYTMAYSRDLYPKCE